MANRNPGTVSILLNIGPGTPAPQARAFVIGDRTIPIGVGAPAVCVQIEPIGGSFDLSDVDLATVSMISDGTGSVNHIASIASKGSHVTDSDENGIAELSACFSRGDLALLFGSIRGRRTLDVTIEGRLGSGAEIQSTLHLTLLGIPANAHRPVTLSPNPMNPRGILSFALDAPGLVSLRLYDLSGRLIRTITESFPAGEHTLVIDGRDDRGITLATGVYFYRMDTPDEATNGRFVVAK